MYTDSGLTSISSLAGCLGKLYGVSIIKPLLGHERLSSTLGASDHVLFCFWGVYKAILTVGVIKGVVIFLLAFVTLKGPDLFVLF